MFYRGRKIADHVVGVALTEMTRQISEGRQVQSGSGLISSLFAFLRIGQVR